MRKHPIPKRPLQSCSALAPTASRVAQFARDSANSWTPDVLFTSLLRAGPPSSRETAPIPPHLTHYLRHFCEAGPPGSRETMNSWTADLLFTSLLRAGSLLLSGSSLLPSAFTFSLEPSKFNGDQMAFSPEPSLPCSSGRLLPPALSLIHI